MLDVYSTLKAGKRVIHTKNTEQPSGANDKYLINFSYDHLHITAWLLEFVVKRCVCKQWHLCSDTRAIKLSEYV